MKRMMALVLTVAMLTSLFAGCAPVEETPQSESAAPALQGKQWDYSGMELYAEDECIVGTENIMYMDLQDQLWGNEVLVPGEEITIGFVPKALENEFWRMTADAIEEEIARMNEAGFKVTVDIRTGQGESDQEGQLAVMLDMVNKGHDIIIAAPISDANLIPGVERAQEAGIPVIPFWVFFRDDPYVDTYMGASSYLEGKLAAEQFAEHIGSEGGRVAVITGIASNVITGARTSGFADYFENNPDLNIEVVDIQNGDWDRMKAKDISDTMLKAYPDLKGIYCNNDTMALGALEAVRSADKMEEVFVGGTDAVSEALTSIADGELYYTTSNFPHYMAKISLVMAVRTLAGENLPENVISPVAGITQENANTPEAEIVGWKEIEWVGEYSN